MKYFNESNQAVIKSWCNNPEESAIDQARNVAKLPFLAGPVVLCSDTHFGFGVPIGCVFATKGVVIPNAVGVDIACFTGDTKVKLTDNRDLTFLELIEEDKQGIQNFCFSLDNENNIVIEKILFPRKIKNADEILEIVLDNNEKIQCTPDHIFYMRNNSQLEARLLKIGDSLMPLYIEKSQNIDIEQNSFHDKRMKLNNYNVVYNPNTNMYDYVHFLADNFNLRNNIYTVNNGCIRHHKDFYKLNNNPTNIERCEWKQHWKIHSNNAKKTNKMGISGFKKARENNPDFFAKMGSDNMTKLHKNKDFCERRDLRASIHLSKYNKSDAFFIMTRDAGNRGKQYLIKRNQSAAGRAKSSEIAHRKYICIECDEEVIGGLGICNHEKKYKHKVRNHTIVSIKFVHRNHDVYCLTVDKYNNFALSAGVFVHNCGMLAQRTLLKQITADQLKVIIGKIRKVIPVGFGKHSKPQPQELMPEMHESNWVVDHWLNSSGICNQEYSNALLSVGSLGGGNHFIELQRDEDGFIWIMIHSGSRNLGKQVCDHYNKIAIDLNEKWHSKVPKEWQLAFLPIDSEEGQSYLKEMNFCIEFAFANRKLMMDRIKEIFIDMDCTIIFDPMINIAHNYARMEHHMGQNVMVHRKGATSAKNGEIGIIPGSQGTHSYIVRGKGNPESFMSCSHGAGRKMGRKEAKRVLNLEEEIKKLDDQGIIHGIRHIDDLDEAAGSYKNVETVMAEQIDLVDIIHRLQPLAVIKG